MASKKKETRRDVSHRPTQTLLAPPLDGAGISSLLPSPVASASRALAPIVVRGGHVASGRTPPSHPARSRANGGGSVNDNAVEQPGSDASSDAATAAGTLKTLHQDIVMMRSELAALEAEQRRAQESQLMAAREKLRQKKRSDLARRLLEAQRLQVVLQRRQEEQEEKRAKLGRFRSRMAAVAEVTLRTDSVVRQRLNFGLRIADALEEERERGAVCECDSGGAPFPPPSFPCTRRPSVAQLVPDASGCSSGTEAEACSRHAETGVGPHGTSVDDDDPLQHQRAALRVHLHSLRRLHTQCVREPEPVSCAKGGARLTSSPSSHEASAPLASASAHESAASVSRDVTVGPQTASAALEHRMARAELRRLEGEDAAGAPVHLALAAAGGVVRNSNDTRAAGADSPPPMPMPLPMHSRDDSAPAAAFETRIAGLLSDLEAKEARRAKEAALLGAGDIQHDERIVGGFVVVDGGARENERARQTLEGTKAPPRAPSMKIRVSSPATGANSTPGVALSSPASESSNSTPSHRATGGGRKRLTFITSPTNEAARAQQQHRDTDDHAACVAEAPEACTAHYAYDAQRQAEADRTALQHSQQQQKFAAVLQHQRLQVAGLRARLQALEREEEQELAKMVSPAQTPQHPNTAAAPPEEQGTQPPEHTQSTESPGNDADGANCTAAAGVAEVQRPTSEANSEAEGPAASDAATAAAVTIQSVFRGHRVRSTASAREDACAATRASQMTTRAELFVDAMALAANNAAVLEALCQEAFVLQAGSAGTAAERVDSVADEAAIDALLAQQEERIASLTAALVKRRVEAAAATRIQAVFRRHSVAIRDARQKAQRERRAAQERLRRNEAAQLLQQHQRSARGRRVGALRRMLLCRYGPTTCHTTTSDQGAPTGFAVVAAVCLQTNTRRTLAARRAQRLRRAVRPTARSVQETEAATIIQALWRKVMAKRHVAGLRAAKAF